MAHQFQLEDQILVHAPAERCFLLSTSIAIVQRELGMHPVRGRTSGHVVGGDTVLWKGWQLGLPQFHESLIQPFDPPFFFRDQMISGRFATFQHDHSFIDRGSGDVLLHDQLRFTMPFGAAGNLVGRLVLVPHIRRLMRRRFSLIKRIAETEEWRKYLPAAASA